VPLPLPLPLPLPTRAAVSKYRQPVQAPKLVDCSTLKSAGLFSFARVRISAVHVCVCALGIPLIAARPTSVSVPLTQVSIAKAAAKRPFPAAPPSMC